jgi:hypothetical protein
LKGTNIEKNGFGISKPGMALAINKYEKKVSENR